MGTRALLQQQGHLITYDGKAARVGIRSEKLLKMAQTKLPNIEAAFQQLLNQSVKVSLEVAGAPPPPNSAPPASTNGDRATPAPPIPVQTKTPPQPATQSAVVSSPPPTHEASNGSEAPSAQHWHPTSDVDRAVKSFAEFFNGQIVDLSDDGDEAAKDGKDDKSSSKPSSSPGRDVPF